MGMPTVLPSIHNPSNFEPSNYEVVEYLDNRPPAPPTGAWINAGSYPELFARYDILRAEWRSAMVHFFGENFSSVIHRCCHCGNGTIRYIAVCLYKPTQEHVVFGDICVDRLGFANANTFKAAQVRAAAQAERIRFTILLKYDRTIAANPALQTVINEANDPVHANNNFAKDILAKLRQYGTLSERQIECVVSSFQRDREYAARRAVEAAEPKGNAPEGRAYVTGTVLSVKEYANNFGYRGSSTWKMLVKLANNSRVFVSVPSSADVLSLRGKKIGFTATFTPKPEDLSFAFGKRPVDLQVLDEATAPTLALDAPAAPSAVAVA